MAPSVVFIDEVEKVFVSDKKKSKEFSGQVGGTRLWGGLCVTEGWHPRHPALPMPAPHEPILALPTPQHDPNPAPPQEPFSRLKKDLVKEVKALRPGDRVIVIGNSREPWLAAKKDEKAFLGFWDKALLLPLPDYASRRVSRELAGWQRCGRCRGPAAPASDPAPALRLWPRPGTEPLNLALAVNPRPAVAPPQLLWPSLFARHGARLPYGFDVPTLAHLSEGHAAGSLDAVVASLLSEARLARLRRRGAGAAVTVAEILQWLSRVREGAEGALGAGSAGLSASPPLACKHTRLDPAPGAARGEGGRPGAAQVDGQDAGAGGNQRSRGTRGLRGRRQEGRQGGRGQQEKGREKEEQVRGAVAFESEATPMQTRVNAALTALTRACASALPGQRRGCVIDGFSSFAAAAGGVVSTSSVS
jgi:hypothetical protein